MKAKLVAHWGTEDGSEFWIGAEAAIGRGADNDVRLDAKPISTQHARIFFDPEAEAYFLEDLGSLNGTQIDGTPVARSERLGRLHVLNFGGVCDLLFVGVDTEPAAAAAAPAPLDGGTRVDSEPLALPPDLEPVAPGEPGREPAREATRVEEAPPVLPEELAPAEAEPAASHEFVLAVIDKGQAKRFPLRDGENLVGRAKEAEARLRSRQLSRRHALLTVAGDRVTVRDLGSRNHTYLDDVEVAAGDDTEVPPRSRLRFGLIEAYLLRRDEKDDLTVPIPLAGE